MSVNGTLVEDKMLRFQGEDAYSSFNKCPIYTHNGASAKFSTNSHKKDNNAAAINGMSSLSFNSEDRWSILNLG